MGQNFGASLPVCDYVYILKGNVYFDDVCDLEISNQNGKNIRIQKYGEHLDNLRVADDVVLLSRKKNK